MAYKCISIDEAKALIDKGGVTVADVRDAASHQSASIENSFNIQPENMEQFLSTAPKDQPLIVYCFHGHSSQGAADYFSEQGYKEVYSIDGGFESWRLKY